ncbi:hypothetical protein Tco_0659473, partial [Tanacetum coccineum]
MKAITTRSGLVLDGHSVPMPLPFINPEEDERVSSLTNSPDHSSQEDDENHRISFSESQH